MSSHQESKLLAHRLGIKTNTSCAACGLLSYSKQVLSSKSAGGKPRKTSALAAARHLGRALRACRSLFKSTARFRLPGHISCKKWSIFSTCLSCILRFGGRGMRSPWVGAYCALAFHDFEGSIRFSMDSKSTESLPSMIVFGTTLTTTDRGHPLAGREDVPFRRASAKPRLGSEMMELPTHPMAYIGVVTGC